MQVFNKISHAQAMVTRLIVKLHLFSALVFFFGCSSVKKLAIEADLARMVSGSEVFKNELIGFSIYDPYLDKFLLNINEDKYFTPASNVKTFTLYAYLSQNLNRVPSFAYKLKGDSLILRPLGDPTFLHPDFPDQGAFEALKKLHNGSIYVSYPDFEIQPYGSGWAWDDYAFDFQPERSQFPLFGNVITIEKSDSTSVNPNFFSDFVDFQSSEGIGSLLEDENIFFSTSMLSPEDTVIERVPFIQSQELIAQLLADTLGAEIQFIQFSEYLGDTLYNGSTLPLMALMMQRSDNFLAEQMLYQSAIFSGKSSIDAYIHSLRNDEMVFLSDSLIWVDGSGLSRYNLVTPRNQVSLLYRIYRTYDWGLLETLFPNGGKSGTIRNWYGDTEPYVFAKTGTLRHNHCLSGYLRAKSGKILIFSFMNNHFTQPVEVIKSEMQSLLENIRDSY